MMASFYPFLGYFLLFFLPLLTKCSSFVIDVHRTSLRPRPYSRLLDSPATDGKDKPLPNKRSFQDYEAFRKIHRSKTIVELESVCSQINVLQNVTLSAAALRRCVWLGRHEQRHQRTHSSKDTILPKLLESAGSGVLTRKISAKGLTDTLVSLKYLSRRAADRQFQPLALETWSAMENEIASTTREVPSTLVECLIARQYLGLSGATSPLYEAICGRLSAGDAIAKLQPLQIIQLLRLLSSTNYAVTESDALLGRLCRRIRKQSVMDGTSMELLVQGMEYSTKLISNTTSLPVDVEAEIRKQLYTTLRYIFYQKDLVLEFDQLVTCVDVLRIVQLPSSDRLLTQIAEYVSIAIHNASVHLLAKFSLNFEVFNRIERLQHIAIIGKKFESLVNDNVGDMEPIDVSNILRPAALCHHRDTGITEPYINAARRLFLNQSFLQHARIRELSNFLWFQKTAMREEDDRGVLESLGSRVLIAVESSDCNPKIASRILSSYVDTYTRLQTGSSEILFDLFYSLGEYLLSSKMSPADVSSAITAYAKASYTLDPGVFDHLLRLLVSMSRVSSNRQLASSYRACGAMMQLETASEQEDGGNHGLPFLESARSIALILAERSSALSKEEVAQAVWTTARLEFDDVHIIDSFVKQAGRLSAQLTPPELSTILWGISRSAPADSETTHLLLAKVASTNGLDFSPAEASSILYALGTLNIRDDVVFHNLSSSILEQIDSSSAQSIANTLWAHQTLCIPPPRKLLDSWTTSKMGIVPVGQHFLN